MIEPILGVSEGFKPFWDEFIEEWKDDEELPLYFVLADLARYISELISQSKDAELKAIFSVIERWHIEGDDYVKEAATVGMLEDLQNINIVGMNVPEQVEKYLLPESKRWWKKVYEFWGAGNVSSD
ncbi:hypothetical protein ACJJID_03340 [Microbulbifer sp. CnH-101-G]|uniref:DUF7674 family protein n=1 Tax=Microbulbifer sp. CnH-101-G TaxID=3243393 RepID=UPI00403A6569